MPGTPDPGLSRTKPRSLPNVILIYGDDVGYGDVGAYGSKKIPTPFIDKLAAEGLRFTDAHSASSTCTPSRYSLLTGELPYRKQNTNIAHALTNMIIAPEQYTLADVFKDAGYATAIIGKWHLGLDDEPINWNGEIAPGPEALGFDHHFIIPASNDRLPTVYVENGKVVGLDPEDPITVQRGRYKNPIPDDVPGTRYPIALLEPDAVTVYKGDHAHSGAVINGIGRIGKMRGGKSALFKDEAITDDLVREAKAFIDGHRDEPFFLFFSANDIHAPRWPHSRFRGKSDHGLRGDAMVSFDWSVGALLEYLKQNQLEENTLIILSSDNGPVYKDGGYEDGSTVNSSGGADKGHYAAGPFRGGKYQVYEGGTRVPFIVKWPGKVAPGTSDALLTQTDLLASFANFLGQKVPAKKARDSRNHFSALIGEDPDGAEVIIQTSFAKKAIRQNQWKYIPHTNELFDLTKDPGETNNLASTYPEKAADLERLLKRYLTEPMR
ncbi:MAG: sulfatase family protein [Opitutales bacterium]